MKMKCNASTIMHLADTFIHLFCGHFKVPDFKNLLHMLCIKQLSLNLKCTVEFVG